MNNDNSISNDINKFDDYLYNLLQSTFHSIYTVNKTHAKNKNYHMYDIIVNISNNFDLNLNLNQKKELYNAGYNCTKDFFKKIN